MDGRDLQFMGLSVGLIVHDMNSVNIEKLWADITYGTKGLALTICGTIW